MDRPELREKGTFIRDDIASKLLTVYEAGRRNVNIKPLEIADQILALIPNTEQIGAMLVEARRTAKKQEAFHTLAQLRYYLSLHKISSLWDDIEGYCQSLEGELEEK